MVALSLSLFPLLLNANVLGLMFTLEIFTKIFAALGPCQSQVLKYAPNILMVTDCSMQKYLLSNLFTIQSHLLVLYGVPLAQSMVHNDY